MSANHFGTAVRGWRERLPPLEGGLETDGNRRVSGLRREELAHLAGVSVDYVVRLEQGRARTPSAQVVTALARALKLDPSERDHLFRCAQMVPPCDQAVPRQVPPRIRRLVQRLADTPVAVYSADWTILEWNPMWTAVIGDPGVYGWADDSLVSGMFGAGDGRRPEAIAAWPVRARDGDEVEERALVADLRVTAVAYPADARLAALIAHTIQTNERFARLWSTGTAGTLADDRKIVEHPLVGSLELDLEVLMVSDADLRIVTYNAADDRLDARKLSELRAAIHSP
ncbi:helix-turn-helix domain-containing protein [Actinocrinis puniceicyclus]|uniref:Helix-turn-helix domain-containing protein n=1 Tax=Actinocrinis puniceicyclus TaxID=977794 RepID=A0A8J7WW36_9ACTN|nr:helix-turn-helix transcriptional regulator [Actinocrinis puniceicyclus]MBS2966199.1 helix-turn-helix domain-containing protein [Actinocrinis puniceicyclus]